MELFVRVNGCGNAWPVFLGTEHPFYDRLTADDLGSASFSVMGCRSKKFAPSDIDWEVVIDAGHHTVPFLLKNENRIPEALFLTHGHLDHILGADWIAQSLYFTSPGHEKLPVYATIFCWQQVLQTIPHLRDAVSFTELKPGRKETVSQVPGLSVTAFPVYHGEGARGAVMLLMEYKKGEDHTGVLFTGDMLFPMLRNEDFTTLSKAERVFIDCTNRYSYPASNHISFTANSPGSERESDFLAAWQMKNPLGRLMQKHLLPVSDEDTFRYMRQFIDQNRDYRNIPFSVLEFLDRTGIPEVHLVHYSGYHDMKYNLCEIMGSRALELWAGQALAGTGMRGTRLSVPKAGYTVRMGASSLTK